MLGEDREKSSYGSEVAVTMVVAASVMKMVAISDDGAGRTREK